MKADQPVKVLMVCLGNICRSPMAEGILRRKAEERGLNVTVDSAGTGAWHAGEPPDQRAIRTAKKFGVDISRLIARKFTEKDFSEFDRIYVMDSENYHEVLRLAQDNHHRVKVDYLLNAHEPGKNMEVPDPWFGGEEGFPDVYRLIEKACDAIVEDITRPA